MDKNELMEKLDIYIKATNEKAEAEGQIKELESQIRMQVDSSYQYSFIRFFWLAEFDHISDMGVLLYTDFGFVKNGNFMQYKL